MSADVDSEAKQREARVLKEEGNELARDGRKLEALRRYEKGIRALGLINYKLDEEGQQSFNALGKEGQELLSVLASNAAQMYLDPSSRQLHRAIDRCTLALEANPNNAKAHFRRASAGCDAAEGAAAAEADELLARAQRDIRRFLQVDEASAAGRTLQERINKKRLEVLGPIGECQTQADEPQLEPEWFLQVRGEAVFVCLCEASGDLGGTRLPDTLLSMALQAKQKKSISVGVAYIGSQGAEAAFGGEWQRKFYRMLRLPERLVEAPPPRRLLVHGQECELWSLIDGRVRILRIEERAATGEEFGLGWARYCAQLLWHGEPFVYQSCCPDLRFAPGWDESLKADLKAAQQGQNHRVALSWVSREHREEPWQWVSSDLAHDGGNTISVGALVAEQFDTYFGWICFRARYFHRARPGPSPIAFLATQNVFSGADLLREVTADPLVSALPLHGQLSCENVRIHSHGWDVFAPSANCTWGGSRSSREASDAVGGLAEGRPPSTESFEEQRARADSLLGRSRQGPAPLADEALDLPVPTATFWTTSRIKDPSPWETGRQVERCFEMGSRRTLSAFERRMGLDMSAQEVSIKSMNAGLSNDREFEDSRSTMQSRERCMRSQLGTRALQRYHTGKAGVGAAPP